MKRKVVSKENFLPLLKADKTEGLSEKIVEPKE